MKIDVYQEQYKSKQAHHEPGRIGFGFDVENVAKLGNAMVGAAQKKFETDDAFNSARIEADTVLAADKMLRDFKETADPDNFETDIENQKQSIQKLISQNSQQFKLPKSQIAFQEKMTRGLEEQYLGQALTYSYGLQEIKYKELAATSADKWKALLLNGSSLITVPEVMANIQSYYTELGKKYHVPASVVDSQIKAQNTSIVSSYAYGMIDKDPQLVKDLLVGQNFSKYKEYKKSIGEDFTMEEFWGNPDLQNDYAQSEFGANWTNLNDYLDFDTRVSLLKLADNELDKQKQEELKQKLLQNSKSDYEIDTNNRAIKDQIALNGTYPAGSFTLRTLTVADDPELGSKGKPIVMGEATKDYAHLGKGNSFTENAKTFADGIDGNLKARGYTTVLTSSLRPGAKGSMHQDGSAADIVILDKNGAWSEQGAIEAYKAVVAMYGNNLRKKGTLFEVDPARVKYIKQQLEQDGIDTSFINWVQSEEYGAKAKGPHIHFGIDKNGNYAETNSGPGQEIKLIGPAADRYLQQRAAGKSVSEALQTAQKEQLELYVALNKYNMKQEMLTSKGADGALLSPAEYGNWITNKIQAITSNKKLSASERVIQMEAAQQLQNDIPNMQQTFVSDPAKFVQESFPQQATTPDNNKRIQAQYGISAENIAGMTKDEAAAAVTKLEKMPIEQAIQAIEGYTQKDLDQLQAQAPEGSKLGVIVYSSYASPALRGDIIKLGTEWENVQKAIKNDSFGENWKSNLTNALLKNPIIKGYFTDIDKTNPQEKTKILDAMIQMGTYKKYAGGASAKDSDIADYIAKNLIANNFNIQTVKNPRWGNTQINLSKKDFNDREAAQITRVCNVLASMGLKGSALYGAENVYLGDVLKAVKTEEAINAKHNIDSMLKTAKLSSDARGLNLVFTRSDPRALTVGTTIKLKTGKPIVVPFKELTKIYNEASSLAGHWKAGTGLYYVPGEYQKAYSDAGLQEMDIPMGSGVNHAMEVAIQYIIANRGDFYWANGNKYKEFEAKSININGVNYDIKYDKYGKELSKVKSKTQPKTFNDKKTTGFAADIYGFNYKGNIDLFNRPQVKNADGSISTVKTVSYTTEIDGKTKYVLIPSISDEGKEMDFNTAVKYWKAKKKHLGIYSTRKEADNVAQQIHEQQERFYLGGE